MFHRYITARTQVSLQQMERWRHMPWILWVGLLAMVVANQATSLLAHVQRSTSPSNINDDVRQQIFPFFRQAGEVLFRDDYIAQYYLANFPLGYRATYTLASWSDSAELLSKLLPYLLLAAICVGVGVAAHRLSGPVAALTSTAIILGCSIYLERLGGGLPRAFGFPLVSLAIAALAIGNAYLIAAAICIAAGFYPVVGVVGGLTLSLWLFCLPARARGQAQDWSWRRRLALLAATFGICVVVLLPTALGSAKYGPIITPDQVEEFPEIGPGGRYISADRAPFPAPSRALRLALDRSLFGAGTPWSSAARGLMARLSSDPKSICEDAVTESIALVALVTWVLVARRRFELMRLLLLPLAAVVGYLLSSHVAPYLYLPQRYVSYTIPPFVALLVSTAPGLGLSLVTRLRRSERQLLAGVVSVMVLLIIGGRGSRSAGLESHVDMSDPILRAVAQLPAQSIVAAWPKGLADVIPYAAKRRVLVSSETHQAFHAGYTLEMRKRVSALVAAFAADSLDPIIILHRDFGVTHMVVRREFADANIPRYFHPFDKSIRDAAARLGNRTPELQKHLVTAAVFRGADATVLSLEKIVHER